MNQGASAGAAPRVSVVTPVYNTAAYLPHCIESVLAQTCGDFEFVIADNCSTDGSGDVARRYAERDPRIRVIAADRFRGQVDNYNFALEQISPGSRYVKVLEADNALLPECLERMCALMDRHPRVTVVSSYNVTETRVRFHGLRTDVEVLNGRDAARLHLQAGAYLFGAPTTVMFRADDVRARRPFYSAAALQAEDQSAVLELLETGDLGFVHQILTFVRTENESILSRVRHMESGELDRYLLLTKHGRSFFDAAEFEALRRGHGRDYYDGLARRLLGGQGRGLLAWHGQRLATIGERVSWPRLARAIARRCAWAALNPGETLRASVRR